MSNFLGETLTDVTLCLVRHSSPFLLTGRGLVVAERDLQCRCRTLKSGPSWRQRSLRRGTMDLCWSCLPVSLRCCTIHRCLTLPYVYYIGLYPGSPSPFLTFTCVRIIAREKSKERESLGTRLYVHNDY